MYVSLPISGHDIEETKEYAEKVKKFLEEKNAMKLLLHLMFAMKKVSPIPITWVGTLKHFWNVMLFSLHQIGKNQRGAWQSLSWQEFMERKF